MAASEMALADINLPEPAFPLKEFQGKRFIAEQLEFYAKQLRQKAELEV